MNKKTIPLGIIAIASLLAAGAIIVALIPQEESVVVKSEIQEGQIIDLAQLPSNMILPNGAELRNVGIQILGGTEIISAEYISSETYPPIKFTWLDSSGNSVAYSSHTIINKPSYYGIRDTVGTIKIWPHLGAEKVKIETWKG